MPMEQVEFEFPDPEKEQALQEVELPETEPETPKLEVAEAVGRETIQPPSKKEEPKAAEASEVEVEVYDDTPPEDRGRKPSKPPEEVTEDELQNYNAGVQKRIKHLSKGYHDERRVKEQALREKEEAIAFAQRLVEENEQLKSRSTQSHNALIESAKKQVESEMAMAQQKYRRAYESGEPDAILEAQQALNSAQIRMEKVSNLKPREVEAEKPLQVTDTVLESQQPAPQPQKDVKAESWREDNPWFGSDEEMTAFALGLHNKLTKGGVNPQSDEYYEKINSRMRQVFPDQFDDGIDDEPEETPKQKPSNVVAPATRSTSPKKVKLSQTQLALAKRLGVSPEQYALQAAKLGGNR